ncbi:MAG TPA: hypothetical protein VHX38_17395 [Pseudonocardiaceae bacterium]|jgi:hypothetical protein|nr:hypothetical protein [Pseudonocardiaceae bacterium]
MAEFVGWVICAVAALAVVGLVIDGIVWLVINAWWLVLIVMVVLAWLLYRHPGVRAKRQLKVIVKRGEQQRDDIKAATAMTKAEMDRIARNWKNR